MTSTSNRTIRPADWAWLVAILAVAVVLRSVRLGSSLWFDEIVSLVEFVRLPLSSLVTSLSSLNNHILYSVEAHVAIAIFGESAWALRLPAMLFGVASVAMLWFFARSVVSPAEANMAALLLAVSYHGIWFSQNARGYTGLMFWALAGTYLFMEGIHRPTWRVWIAYGLVVAAAAYTHLSAGFFFVIHGLVYLALLAWRGRFGKRYPGLLEFKPFAGFLIGGLVAFLLHAPLLPQLLAAMQSVAVTSASETTVAEWKNPLWTILEVVRNLRSLGFVALVGLPVVLGFSTIGAVSLSRRQPVVAAIALIHIPLTLVILILMSFRIWPRYFFIDLAFIFLCLVRGVFVFAEFVAPYFSRLNAFFQTERLGVLACLSAAICSLFLLPPNYRFPKQDFLGAKEFVETARTPQDNVVSIGLASYAYSQYYGGPDWKVAESWPEIQEIRHSTGRTWLIYTSTAHMNENYPDVVTGVASDFELVKLFPGTLGDGAVFVYRSRGSLGASLRP